MTASASPTLPTSESVSTGEVYLCRHRTNVHEGVAFVYDPQGCFVAQFDTGKQGRFERKQWPLGATFTVRVLTHDGPDVYDVTFTFRVTGDPDDIEVVWTGHGLIDESERLRSNPRGSEYGVHVEGAVLA